MADGSITGLSWAKGVVIADEDPELIVERESQVLGAVLTNPDVWAPINHLDALDFCVSEFRAAWSTICGFARAGELHKVRPRAVAQAAGVSITPILGCVRDLVSPLNAPDHAQDMIAARAIREGLRDARIAQRETDPARVLQALQRATKRVGAVRTRLAYSAAEAADRFLARYSEIASGHAPSARSTGLIHVDEAIGGLAPGDLQVWAGRPGMGKTSATISIARQASACGARIGYFSLEIGEAQTMARVIADAIWRPTLAIPFGAIMRGQVAPHQMNAVLEAVDRVRSLPLHFAFTPGLTVVDIEAQIDRWEQEAGEKLDAIVVDQSNFIRDTGRYKDNTVKSIGEIFIDIKIMMQRRAMTAIVIHQLNRGVESRENKRPTMADLRDSGEIEQAADVVCLLYRHEYYLSKVDASSMQGEARDKHEAAKAAAANKLELIFDKNRAGEPGPVIVQCHIGSSAIRTHPRD